jgi:hypothetical protein
MSRLWEWRVVGIAIMSVLLLATPARADDRSEGKAVHSERPIMLVPLYIGFAALQALDVHSTLSALDTGAREANPVVGSAIGSPAGMLIIKAATAAGVVALSERLWRRNRTAAVLTMIGLNSAYAMIAAHNYGTVGR